MGKRDRAVDLGSLGGDCAEAANLGDEPKKFVDRHLGVGGCVLRQVAEFPFDRNRVGSDVKAVDHGGAGVGTQEASEHLHRGRFAGSIGPEETENFSTTDRKGDATYGSIGTVCFDELFDFNHVDKGGDRPS